MVKKETVVVVPQTNIYGSKKKSRAPVKPKKKVDLRKFVKNIISGYAEKKFGGTQDQDIINEPLLIVTVAGGAFEQFISPLNPPFIVAEGTEQDERVGNSYRLKSWNLAISITPIIQGAVPFITSPQLYVTLYILRRKDGGVLSSAMGLVGLYQNGNSSYTPDGRIDNRLAYINHDEYIIYYKKNMKLGVASPETTYAPYNGLANNDFKLIAQFRVDMCKVMKGMRNKKLTYPDATNTVQNAVINSLYIATVITNASGQPITNAIAGLSTYDISMSNRISYIDL